LCLIRFSKFSCFYVILIRFFFFDNLYHWEWFLSFSHLSCSIHWATSPLTSVLAPAFLPRADDLGSFLLLRLLDAHNRVIRVLLNPCLIVLFSLVRNWLRPLSDQWLLNWFRRFSSFSSKVFWFWILTLLSSFQIRYNVNVFE
jgi:hypothetical protein